MTSVDAQTHLQMTTFLSAVFLTVLMISHLEMHVSSPGTGFGQGPHQDMRANPKVEK